MLDQTGLTLVVAKGEGHNPVRAVRDPAVPHEPHLPPHDAWHRPDLETARRPEECGIRARLPRSDRDKIQDDREQARRRPQALRLGAAPQLISAATALCPSGRRRRPAFDSVQYSVILPS